ncbi:MAG TPA: hypothetical protein VKB93_08600 [Thermoanaerobaculia bacterium]|nr:hypothetical protein [Thermoanaerobaculia bacterium]
MSELPEPIPAVPSHLTAERRVIAKWLQERAPSLAELYDSALSLIFERPLPGSVRLVSHCVREIASGLARSVPSSGSSRIAYAQVKRIAAAWPVIDSQLLRPDAPDVPPEMVIPREAYVAVDALIRAHAGARNFEETLQLMFAAENRSATPLIRPAVQRFKQVYDWFQQRAHDRGDIDAALCTDQDLRSNFEAFENGLYTLAGEWIDVQEKVDELLEEANRRTD